MGFPQLKWSYQSENYLNREACIENKRVYFQEVQIKLHMGKVKYKQYRSVEF